MNVTAAMLLMVLVQADGGTPAAADARRVSLDPPVMLRLDAPRTVALRPESTSALRAVQRDFERSLEEQPLRAWRPQLKDVQLAASRYGRSGQQYDEPAGRREADEQPAALVKSDQLAVDVVRSGGNAPGSHSLGESLAAGRRLLEFADGAASTPFSLVLEVSRFGDQTQVRLLKASPSSEVDAWVLERARAVACPEGHRTVWRLTCRTVSKRNDVSAGALAASAAASLVMGGRVPAVALTFDELSKRVDVVDVLSPSLACQLTLLEADVPDGGYGSR